MFELLDITIQGNESSDSLHIVTIYRPPKSNKNKFNVSDFIEELAAVLESIVLSPGRLILQGDFNIHMDDTNDPNTSKFLDLLDSFNLRQHIKQPTQDKGHIIDLVITRADDICVHSLTNNHCLPH
jgi:exonuclease III